MRLAENSKHESLKWVQNSGKSRVGFNFNVVMLKVNVNTSRRRIRTQNHFTFATLMMSGMCRYAATGGRPLPIRYASSAFCLKGRRAKRIGMSLTDSGAVLNVPALNRTSRKKIEKKNHDEGLSPQKWCHKDKWGGFPVCILISCDYLNACYVNTITLMSWLNTNRKTKRSGSKHCGEEKCSPASINCCWL